MSTHDVPGTDPKHKDQLAMGCWAEHDDGSMILVEGTEKKRVIYSIFDLSDPDHPIKYFDAMKEKDFKKQFSFNAGSSKEKWTWHDKTPFPWDRIIKKGAKDGLQPQALEHLTAAKRIAQALGIAGAEVDPQELAHLTSSETPRRIMDKLQRKISELPAKKQKKVNKLISKIEKIAG